MTNTKVIVSITNLHLMPLQVSWGVCFLGQVIEHASHDKLLELGAPTLKEEITFLKPLVKRETP
jgi:hypothetical protein